MWMVELLQWLTPGDPPAASTEVNSSANHARFWVQSLIACSRVSSLRCLSSEAGCPGIHAPNRHHRILAHASCPQFRDSALCRRG
jgi:hypothetical protein